MNTTRPGLVGVNDRGYRVGESHHLAKLSDSVVDTIRTLHEDSGLTCRQISSMLSINYHTVRSIVSYARRAQVPREWRREKSHGKQERQTDTESP